MKKSLSKIISSLLIILLFASCKKESKNLFNMFDDLKIDYKSTLGSDEVYIEFNLSKPASGANMSKVMVTEVGSTAPVYTKAIPYTQRYSYFSGVIILKANNPETVNYKIIVLDDANNDITSQVTITYPTGTLKASNPILVDNSRILNFSAGSTVYLDYTIISEKQDINSVKLESFAKGLATETTNTVATLTNDDDRRYFRGAIRLVLNRDGLTRYRVYAFNNRDEYMGDGYKYINTKVDVGYELSANKYIYGPDSSSTANNPDLKSACFYSILKKRAYNYEDAKTNSADIDFGIYITYSPTNPRLYFLNIYTPNDIGNPVSGVYNFSNWTKRNTKFTGAFTTAGALNAASVFNDIMVSGLAIKNQASIYSIVMNRNRVVNIASGSIIYFLTQEGKYGAIYINNFNKDYLKRTFVNFDVKIEK